jgi:hypothetical protein
MSLVPWWGPVSRCLAESRVVRFRFQLQAAWLRPLSAVWARSADVAHVAAVLALDAGVRHLDDRLLEDWLGHCQHVRLLHLLESRLSQKLEAWLGEVRPGHRVLVRSVVTRRPSALVWVRGFWVVAVGRSVAEIVAVEAFFVLALAGCEQVVW